MLCWWSSLLLIFIPYAAAAAAKSRQSCPTLCDPMDCSLPGSSIHGILQARVLEWVPLPSPIFLIVKPKSTDTCIDSSSLRTFPPQVVTVPYVGCQLKNVFISHIHVIPESHYGHLAWHGEASCIICIMLKRAFWYILFGLCFKSRSKPRLTISSEVLLPLLNTRLWSNYHYSFQQVPLCNLWWCKNLWPHFLQRKFSWKRKSWTSLK